MSDGSGSTRIRVFQPLANDKGSCCHKKPPKPKTRNPVELLKEPDPTTREEASCVLSVWGGGGGGGVEV